MEVDKKRLGQFMGKMLADFGAAANAALIRVGDQLGLYKALAKGPMTPQQLADATGTHERNVREWLSAQAASGYVDYDPATQTFSMRPEQILAFADENSPYFMGAMGDMISALTADEPKVTEAFRGGQGVGWNARNGCLFCATARFLRTAYRAKLVQEWLPSLDGVVAKLERGCTVADVGCGHADSTILMAKAFPNVRLVGIDAHPGSIEAARENTAKAGLADRIGFEIATAKTFRERGFDLVCFFGCLHDMGDPVGALRHVRESLNDGGTVMLVEPFANDRLEDNFTPVGRLTYATSTMICTPAAMAQDGGFALGAQAGEARLREVANAAGFRHFRRAAETAFNLVFEVRP